MTDFPINPKMLDIYKREMQELRNEILSTNTPHVDALPRVMTADQIEKMFAHVIMEKFQLPIRPLCGFDLDSLLTIDLIKHHPTQFAHYVIPSLPQLFAHIILAKDAYIWKNDEKQS